MPTERFHGTDNNGNNELILNIEWSAYPGETTINGAIFSWGITNRLIEALLRARDETHGAHIRGIDRSAVDQAKTQRAFLNVAGDK